jgi:hypothetical protein
MYKKCGYGNFNHQYNISLMRLHAFLGVGNFMKACVPTAKEVVSVYRKFEKH